MFENLTDEQVLAWTAAFLEGEGSIQKSQIAVAQTDREVIQALVDYFEIGKVYEKDSYDEDAWVDAYYWHINRGREIDEFLEQIRPYIQFRQNEVDAVLDADRGHAHWTDGEREYIHDHWVEMSDEQMAGKLDRTTRGVSKQRREMGHLRTEHGVKEQTGV